jgi:hypothetical protein
MILLFGFAYEVKGTSMPLLLSILMQNYEKIRAEKRVFRADDF